MIIPILHRVLVKAHKLSETDETYLKAKAIGITIAETEDVTRKQAGIDKGVVIAIGPTAFRDFNTEVPIAVGDHVAWARFGGKIITDPETKEDFVALNDEDIVCIFKETK